MISPPCPVRQHLIKGFLNKIGNPFPLLNQDRNAQLTTIGQGDGISLLEHTKFQLITMGYDVRYQFLHPCIDFFDVKQLVALNSYFLADVAALGLLVTDPKQSFLNAVNEQFEVTQVHAVHCFAENDDEIETFGAVWSQPTKTWMLRNFRFKKEGNGQNQHPWILLFFPPPPEE